MVCTCLGHKMSPKEQRSRGLQGTWPAPTSPPATASSRRSLHTRRTWGGSSRARGGSVPEFPAEHGTVVPRGHRVATPPKLIRIIILTSRNRIKPCPGKRGAGRPPLLSVIRPPAAAAAGQPLASYLPRKAGGNLRGDTGVSSASGGSPRWLSRTLTNYLSGSHLDPGSGLAKSGYKGLSRALVPQPPTPGPPADQRAARAVESGITPGTRPWAPSGSHQSLVLCPGVSRTDWSRRAGCPGPSA